MRRLRARLQLDQGGDGLAVATRPRQRTDRHAVDAAVAAQHDERVHGAALEGAIEAVAGLEGEARRVVAVAGAGAHPAFLRDDDRDRLVDDLDLGHGALFGLDEGAALVAELLGIGLDLFDHGAAQHAGVAQDLFELGLLTTQLGQLLLDLDGFQPGQLAQADVKDVVGLALRELESLDQRGLGLVALADDADDLVDVEQHQLPAFEDVDAVEHLGQAVLGAAGDGLHAEADPLAQNLPHALEHGLAVGAHHGQVDRHRGFEAGVGQQRGDELLLRDGARLGLEDQAHGGIFAGLVAHGVQHRQQHGLELQLVGRQGLLAVLDLGVAELFDLFQHLLRAGAVRQFGDDQLPLAAGHVLDHPAGAHLEAAAAGAVGLADVVGRGNQLAAAGEVRSGQQLEELVVGELVVFDQGDRGRGHFAQVVAGDFRGQAHGDAAGAVEQHERQAPRQLLGLLGGAVVVGDEIDRAHVDLVEQQAGDGRQARLGVAHRGGAIAIA